MLSRCLISKARPFGHIGSLRSTAKPAITIQSSHISNNGNHKESDLTTRFVKEQHSKNFKLDLPQTSDRLKIQPSVKVYGLFDICADDNTYRRWNNTTVWRYALLLTGSLVVAAGLMKLITADVNASEDQNSIHKKTTATCNDDENNAANVATRDERLKTAIREARIIAERKMVGFGCPGMAIAVTVDGETVWQEGLGFADLENNIRCRPETVLRIASISKPITMATVARLWESGDLDIDKPISEYLPDFPTKTWEGKKVDITTRQLLSHLGGIRHYDKTYMQPEPKDGVKEDGSSSNDEMLLKEYYIAEHYKNVSESLQLFQDDPLVHKPGTKFLYTSHGWTLISAVVEKAAKRPFEDCLRQTLDDLGMDNTYLEHQAPIIPNRGRHYVKGKNGRVQNAPYVDLSYKWAGGGLISNVLDILKFGNAMLCCYQPIQDSDSIPENKTITKDACNLHGNDNESDKMRGSAKRRHFISKLKSSKDLKPDTETTNTTLTSPKQNDLNTSGSQQILRTYLKPKTLKQMWSTAENTVCDWGGIKDGGYGLGWAVWKRVESPAYCRKRPFFVSHTGGAVGASSVLLIVPKEAPAPGGNADSSERIADIDEHLGELSESPNGVVVAIIGNMTSVELNRTAFDIAQLFSDIKKHVRHSYMDKANI